MSNLLVIGGASLDILHLQNRTVESAGGAGLYTAMAARRCGARVALFAPRPEPCPERLAPVASRLSEWLGPAVTPEALPHFEISYRGNETDFLKATFEGEQMLSPAMLPRDLAAYDMVHVVPLGDAERQLAFIQACRQRGAGRISAGTWPRVAQDQPRAVRDVLEQCDVFFMNDLEAGAIFGSVEAARTDPGKMLYITLGSRGAFVIQGDHATRIPSQPAAVLDPTGAGDTFCGAALAYLIRHEHPVMAAHRAVALAAEMIEQIGPEALLSDDPPPTLPLDPRVRVNPEQVRKVAAQVSTLSDASPYPFVGPQFPSVGDPRALDYFFTTTLQQFSFWYYSDNRYEQPLIATIGGVKLKGSDYLWEAFRRRLALDPNFYSPERQANLSRDDLLAILRADNGDDPMPSIDMHLQLARRYGRDMLALQLTPEDVLENSLASAQPLQAFLTTLDHIGGYKEDPLRKKSSLLAMILNQRPEQFLPLRNDEEIAPVIDYHVQRSCLRVGLLDVLDRDLAERLAGREIVSIAEEWAVRYAAYTVMDQIAALSGRSMGAVDYLFFQARGRCPEMTEPECQRCPLDPVCAHRKELFQPVLRTTFY